MGGRRKRRVIIDAFHNAAENRTCGHTTRMAIYLIRIRIVHQNHADIANIFYRSKTNEGRHLMGSVILACLLVKLFSSTRLPAKDDIRDLFACHCPGRSMLGIHHAIEHLADRGCRTFRNHATHLHRVLLFDQVSV